MVNYTILDETPIGPLYLYEQNGFLIAVTPSAISFPQMMRQEKTAVLQKACRQLEEYFRGERKHFTLPLKFAGTPFQQEVWTALQRIPYGKTCTYREIAEQIAHPKAVRAVGMANHRNPLLIIVPCHRVIGAGGKLTGYAAGIEIKHYLLKLEREHCLTGGNFMLPPK